MSGGSERSEGAKGLIFNIDETAIHDGFGVRMVVYLKGCPLRCVWCHSPESISPAPEVVWYETRCTRCGKCIEVCPQGVRGFDLLDEETRRRCTLCGNCVEACPNGALEIKGEYVTAGEIVRAAERLIPFFRRTGGGITLSGGEPLSQPEFARAVAALCKEAGIHTAIEISGYCDRRILEQMCAVTDLFLYDIKHSDNELHKRYTGVSNVRILDNLQWLVSRGADVVVRVPLIPRHNDSPEEVEAIGRQAKAIGAAKISLLPFNPATRGKYSWLRKRCPVENAKKQDAEYVKALENRLHRMGLEVLPP